MAELSAPDASADACCALEAQADCCAADAKAGCCGRESCCGNPTAVAELREGETVLGKPS